MGLDAQIMGSSSRSGYQPEHGPGVDGNLVVVTAEVLDEGVASDHDARCLMSLEPTHRSEPGLHPAMVTPHPVVLILTSVVPCAGKQLLDHVRQRRRPVRDHLGRCILNSQRSGEGRAWGGDVATFGDATGR